MDMAFVLPSFESGQKSNGAAEVYEARYMAVKLGIRILAELYQEAPGHLDHHDS
jgi:hypothetical protein